MRRSLPIHPSVFSIIYTATLDEAKLRRRTSPFPTLAVPIGLGLLYHVIVRGESKQCHAVAFSVTDSYQTKSFRPYC